MVVAVWAVLVALLELLHVFPEAFSALLAGEDHLQGWLELVRLGFSVAFGTVEPFPAAGGPDRNLGVENVFAGEMLGGGIGRGDAKQGIPHGEYKPSLSYKMYAIAIDNDCMDAGSRRVALANVLRMFVSGKRGTGLSFRTCPTRCETHQRQLVRRRLARCGGFSKKQACDVRACLTTKPEQYVHNSLSQKPYAQLHAPV